MSIAIGIVAHTAKVPHGEPNSAMTTTSASTASRMNMIDSTPSSAMTPAVGPISVRIRSPSERPSRRVEMNMTVMSCTAPAKITPASSQIVPGR